MSKNQIEQKCIDTVRVLSADAVQKANSGHPGTPMGLAAIGHILWAETMNFNPRNPDWPNRDRFILSAGHACMLQYSFLYLTGYDITMEDLKNFRQLHSTTAGHPEYGLLSGVEVTTGPLGQGFANGVGFAIAQKYMANRYNRSGFDLFDYKIYAICSDGDLMEGVASEAASLAGHLRLGNLIYIYDDNHISIEGDTDLTFDQENVAERFEAYGWHVQELDDGNDLVALRMALRKAKQEDDRPSLIKVRTHIGYGSPNKQDTAEAHGAPLGEDEVRLVKKNFGFDPDERFKISKTVSEFYDKVGKKGAEKERDWNELYKKYKHENQDLAKEYEFISSGKLPHAWADQLPIFKSGEEMATRKASGLTLNAISKYFPQLIGGSADLAPSTKTLLDGRTSFSASNRDGRNFHFGVREHAMGAILNGMALSKYLIPYGATFLIFSDYMRPPLRLAAIMKIRTIMVFTHDSIGLGEDGTTHQPVEQLLGLRSIPNMTLIRPADANETAQAWRVALEHSGGPVAIALTRQSVPNVDQEKYRKADALEKGAYILSEAKESPDLILIGTGSEIHLALAAQDKLKEQNVDARVVSMPSWALFEKQEDSYKESVFPKKLRKRLVVEAGTPMGWHRYVTDEGDIIGVDKFGESAPGDEIMKAYGFTVDNIVKRAKALLSK